MLLQERHQLDTLLVPLHSSTCLLQRTVKHVLSYPVLFCCVLFCVPAKEIVCIYLSWEAERRLAAPTISKARRGRLKYSGIYIGVLGFGSKERKMDGWEIRSEECWAWFVHI